ncbi:FmdB family zinc ribbon protein [Sessilibacter corallicola]|uniref:Putative regulatory protein FmdB zinc ribbon domain-containing protein n=1 Tax=Sessilibacter corallicola TaxID=2904075 RepID=A0ABQ0A7L1_9GAMM|nr:zinc ribbon domain-containing protein [Sessilibacter corallicola]MCE2028810.1 zinc ribbon domain-containing protein [Sessilibacter corallicola]
MPIYEYVCKSCDHEFEALQKMSDDPLTQCPQCNNLSLTKKISAAGFRLSGSGWYETDFKSGKKKNLTSSSDSKSQESGTQSSGSSKTKSTPAATS